MNNVAERLERLPFGKFHVRLLLMGGLGYMFEAVDAAIIAFLLPVLRTKWQLSSIQTGFLASSTFYGFLVGALCAGAIGDRFGRKNVMMWALVFFCLASLASAAVNDWHQFFALRIIGGMVRVNRPHDEVTARSVAGLLLQRVGERPALRVHRPLVQDHDLIRVGVPVL